MARLRFDGEAPAYVADASPRGPDRCLPVRQLGRGVAIAFGLAAASDRRSGLGGGTLLGAGSLGTGSLGTRSNSATGENSGSCREYEHMLSHFEAP